jgi:hypothetical protein
MLFDLGPTASSDKITLTAGTLSIGTGVLEFDDFAFTPTAGFGAGSYTLFDTNAAITGSLGTNLSGTINGLNATLAISGDGQDVLLNVAAVPEPQTWAMMVSGAGLLMMFRRRRR